MDICQRSSEGTAFNQLRSTADGIRNSGAAIGGLTPRDALSQCLALAIDAARRLQCGPDDGGGKSGSEANAETTVATTGAGKSAAFNSRLHCDAYEVLAF